MLLLGRSFIAKQSERNESKLSFPNGVPVTTGEYLLFFITPLITKGRYTLVNNAVGRRAQKCTTSKLLDRVFADEEEIGSFTIPYSGRHIFQAQLSGASIYVPLPNYSIAESLQVGISGFCPQSEDEEKLKFLQDPQEGWQSQRV